MAVYFNGTNIPENGDNFWYNGVNLDKVYYNNVLVWEKKIAVEPGTASIQANLFSDLDTVASGDEWYNEHGGGHFASRPIALADGYGITPGARNWETQSGHALCGQFVLNSGRCNISLGKNYENVDVTFTIEFTQNYLELTGDVAGDVIRIPWYVSNYSAPGVEVQHDSVFTHTWTNVTGSSVSYSNPEWNSQIAVPSKFFWNGGEDSEGERTEDPVLVMSQSSTDYIHADTRNTLYRVTSYPKIKMSITVTNGVSTATGYIIKEQQGGSYNIDFS